MSIPKCLQNPKLRPVKLSNGRTAVAEKLGPQHYLIWIDGKALTEVQCVPTESSRWYCRGSGMNWSKTRAIAINTGRALYAKGRGIRGELPPWSAAAQKAIDGKDEA